MELLEKITFLEKNQNFKKTFKMLKNEEVSVTLEGNEGEKFSCDSL